MANARLGWFSPLGVAFASEIAARRVDASARRVGLRVRSFRFSARAASGLPLGGLAFGLTTSAFRHAPLRGCPRRVGLRAHRFRFSACTASGLPSAGWFFCLPFRRLPLGGLAFGLTASAFRHAPLRDCRSAGWPSGSRLPLFGTHRFGVAARRVGASASRFGAGRSSGWPSGSRLSLFGTHRFGVALGGLVLLPSVSEIALGGLILPLGGLVFGLTASAFRHAPLRSGRWAGWPSDSPLPLFGTRRSAPPHRRSEDRRSTTTRHLFHFKTLIPTC